MVGNNTPVFFIRDAIKFPDFIHTQKQNPATGRPDNNMAWDFWTQQPESFHQTSILFGDRGTPYGFRHMHGYSSHTFKWVNAEGEQFYVQYTLKTNSGIKNFTAEESAEMTKTNPNFSKQDLWDSIEAGEDVSWTWYIQIMPVAEADTAKFDVLDITKVWYHADYELIPIGKLVLNRNPENWFAEVEQSAFSPNNLVPGIEASNCKMLQGRLFSYPDTHRHRLGRNYQQMPINNSYRSHVNNYHRDGESRVDGNSGSSVNYEPNTLGGPAPDPKWAAAKFDVSGQAGRFKYTHPNDDFEQPRKFYREVLDEGAKQRIAENIAGHMADVTLELKQKALAIYR